MQNICIISAGTRGRGHSCIEGKPGGKAKWHGVIRGVARVRGQKMVPLLFSSFDMPCNCSLPHCGQCGLIMLITISFAAFKVKLFSL